MNKENCALKLVDEIILYYDARSKKRQITYLLILQITKIYIKIHTKMLLHVSVYDHHQGARTWA